MTTIAVLKAENARLREVYDAAQRYADQILATREGLTLVARIEALERWVRSHDADPDCLS